jgi:hypothetical protein
MRGEGGKRLRGGERRGRGWGVEKVGFYSLFLIAVSVFKLIRTDGRGDELQYI